MDEIKWGEIHKLIFTNGFIRIDGLRLGNICGAIVKVITRQPWETIRRIRRGVYRWIILTDGTMWIANENAITDVEKTFKDLEYSAGCKIETVDPLIISDIDLNEINMSDVNERIKDYKWSPTF